MTAEAGIKWVLVAFLLSFCRGNHAPAKRVTLNDLPLLNFISEPDCARKAKIGEAHILQCACDPGRASSVKWFQNGRLVAQSSEMRSSELQTSDATSQDDNFPSPAVPVANANGRRSTSHDVMDNLSVQSNGSLLIHKVNELSAGVYSCVISDDHGQQLISGSCRLMLRGSSLLNIFTTSHAVAEGETVRFSCRARHAPPSYVWNFNGAALPHNSRRFALPDALQIINATPSDAGRYKCCVSNLFSSCSNYTELTLTKQIGSAPHPSPQISWVAKPRDITVARDGTAVLECLAQAEHQNVVYTWKKINSHELCLDCRDHLENGNLRLLGVTERDAGTYNCTARAGSKSLHHVVRVNVSALPRVTCTSKRYRADFAKVLSIRCSATGFPPPQLDCFRNGGRIAEAAGNLKPKISVSPKPGGRVDLRIRHIGAADRGLYQCRAKNRYGSDTFTVSVDLTRSSFYAAPQNLSVISVDHSSANLRWRARHGMNATLYMVLYENATALEKANAMPLCDPWCTYQLSNLHSNSDYQVTVQAHDGKELSLQSPPVHFTTDPECPPPTHIPLDTITIKPLGPTQLLVSWLSLPDDCGQITSYKIKYSDFGSWGNMDIFDLSESVEVRVTEPTRSRYYGLLDNLLPDTDYVMAIVASTRSGIGDEGDDYKDGSTLALSSDIACRADDQNFTVRAKFLEQDSLIVDWKISPSVAPDKFQLVVRDALDARVLLDEKVAAIDNRFRTNLLDRSGAYTIHLTVLRNDTVTCLTTTTAVLPGVSGLDDAPVVTSLTPVNTTQLRVSWTHLSEPDPGQQAVKFYRVRCKAVDAGPHEDAIYINSTSTSLIISDLRAQTLYEVAVQAIFSNQVEGRSASSPFSFRSLTARTLAAVLPAPTRVCARAADGWLKLSWQMHNWKDGSVAYYRIVCVCAVDGDEKAVKLEENISGTETAHTFVINPHVTDCDIRIAAASSAGPGPDAVATLAASPHCPAIPGTTTTPPPRDETTLAIIVGCCISLFFLILCCLVLCCCCTWKNILDGVRCSCCKDSANTLKQCTAHSHMRTRSTNRDSGICMSPPAGQNPELERLTSNGGRYCETQLKQDPPQRNGFHSTKNGFHSNHNGIHHVPNGYILNSTSTKSTQNRDQQPGNMNLLQILFNKDARVDVPRQAQNRRSQSQTEGAPILSVPIPKHSKSFLMQNSRHENRASYHRDDLAEVTRCVPLLTQQSTDDDCAISGSDMEDCILSPITDTPLLMDIVRSLPRIMPPSDSSYKLQTSSTDTSNYSSQSNASCEDNRTSPNFCV